MPLIRWFTLLCCLGLFAYVLADEKGSEALKAVVDYQRDLYKQAQAKAIADGSKIDTAGIQAKVKAKAEESVKGVDPTKIKPGDALEWAQVFTMAGQTKVSQSLIESFIATKPDPPHLYEGQRMLLTVSLLNKDDKTAVDTIQSMKPYSKASSLGLAALVIDQARLIEGRIGPDNLAVLLDHTLSEIDSSGLTPALRARFEALQESATLAKIDAFKRAGKPEKAVAVIDAAIKTADGSYKATLATVRNRLTLIGTPAPALKFDRAYGKFDSLASLKGKVVVLDFFAHWCQPCKAEFADLTKMQADLGGQGLEVVGVTQYYGFFGDRSKKLSPDEEYAKMGDFIKDQKIAWPVIFEKSENFQAFGVTAFPYFVVIDRAGVISAIEVATPDRMGDLRKTVESLMAKK